MNRFYYLIFVFFILSNGLQGQVVINEIMSDNDETLSSSLDITPDYIELYNASDEAIDLDGYFLSDDEEELAKWEIKNRIIESSSFILIYASGLDLTEAVELHTNFKISSEGEAIYLTNSDGQLIDEFESVELNEDEAYGRIPDGTGSKFILPIPSPESTNNLSDVVMLSHSRGYYNTPITLTMENVFEGEVRFTRDGSVPVSDSELYVGPILLENKKSQPNIWSEIPTSPDQSFITNHAWQSPGYNVDKAHVIRCATFNNGQITSPVYTNSYFVDEDIFDKYDMPIVSLITDGDNLFGDENGIYVPGNLYDEEDPVWTGNYFESDTTSERPVHIEYFEKDGKLGFAQNGGVRIHGGKTRHAAQKSLRLYSRSKYDHKYFNYKLLPQKDVDKYKRFVLSTTMGSWGGQIIVKDILSHEVARDFDFERQDYRPVVVFINGEYWGIQTIRDRLDEYYLEYTTGIDKDSFKIWNWGFMNDSAVKDLLEDNHVIDDAEYEFLTDKIDIESFIDYQIVEMYLNNYDWPANNVKHWKSRRPDSKWRYIFFDTDGGFGDYDYNMLEHCTEDDPDITWPTGPKFTFLFTALLTNDAFKNQFLDRYAEVLGTSFDPMVIKSKLNDIIVQYELEMSKHINRWHFPNSMDDWKDDIDSELVEFIDKRPCAVESQIKAFFDIEDFGFECSTNSSNPINLTDTFSLYPNPTAFYINLQNNTENIKTGTITILDITGKSLMEFNEVQIESDSYFNIDINALPAGMYIFKYASLEGDFIKKITIF